MCWVERKAQRGCHSCPKRCDSVLLGEGRAGVLHGRDFCSAWCWDLFQKWGVRRGL